MANDGYAKFFIQKTVKPPHEVDLQFDLLAIPLVISVTSSYYSRLHICHEQIGTLISCDYFYETVPTLRLTNITDKFSDAFFKNL